MNETIENCGVCGKPLIENHVCWGESSDFATVRNIPDDEDAGQSKKAGPVKSKENPKKKARGRPKIVDGRTGQQRWKDKNKEKVKLYQRNYMRESRAKKKAEKEKAEEESKQND